MSRTATYVVALLIVAGACGDSGDTTTSTPAATVAPTTTAAATTTAPSTTTTAAPTTTAPTTTVPPTTAAPPSADDVFAEMERRILAAGIVGDGVPVSRDEAACLAQAIADTLGFESLDMAAADALLTGSAADPLAGATGEQAAAILTAGADCVDIVAALEAEAPPGVDPEEYVLEGFATGVLEGTASDGAFDVTEAEARCVGEGMFDALGLDGIEALALAAMLGLGDPDSPLPGATDEQLTALVQTMLGCVDFAALLSATFQEDGLSPQSADCAAAALLDTTFFEELVVQIALGGEALPEDPEVVGEVAQLLLACLTPEELGELITEG